MMLYSFTIPIVWLYTQAFKADRQNLACMHTGRGDSIVGDFVAKAFSVYI